MLVLAGCGFWSKDPVAAVKQIAAVRKTEADATTFQVIAQYPWELGTIVVYSIDSTPTDPRVSPHSIGYGAVDQSGRVVLWSEGSINTDPNAAPLGFDVGRQRNPNPVTMAYGEIHLAEVQKVEVIYQDGFVQSVQPISNTFAVARTGSNVPCSAIAYNANGMVIDQIDRDRFLDQPSCNK